MSDEFETPRSRNEAILQNIIGADNELVEAQSRIEAILQAILNNGTYSEEAKSRIETILLKILNGETYEGEVKSRNEAILKAIANNGTYDKEPRSRIEELLIAWLNYGVLTVKTGAIVSISNALAKNVVSLVVDIEAVQSGTGEPSPDNVRPITGHDSVEVVRCGKNLLPPHGVGRTNNQVEYTVNDDGSITLTGTATGGTSWWKGATTLSDYDFIKAGTYHLSGGISNNIMVYVIGKYVDGTGLSNMTVTGGVYDKGNGLTFTLTQDAYATYQIQVNNGTATGVTIKPQIELGSTATTYEPYHGNSYDINLPSMVYGGTLDVVTGVLTVTHGYIASYDGESLPSTWISDRDVYAEGTTPTIGAEVIYALATPLTYTLTPTAIELFEDNNTLWSSDGDVILTYYAKKEA